MKIRWYHKLLEYAGMTTGMLGALLIAFRQPFAGHVAWVVGNPCLVALGLLTRQWGLAAMFFVYWCIAITGAINW